MQNEKPVVKWILFTMALCVLFSLTCISNWMERAHNLYERENWLLCAIYFYGNEKQKARTKRKASNSTKKPSWEIE